MRARQFAADNAFGLLFLSAMAVAFLAATLVVGLVNCIG